MVTKNPVKYIFVLGGVISGLGKGIAAASIGYLLKSAGLKVTIIKLDPYSIKSVEKLLKIADPVMLLTSPKISVVPITQHLSLKNAIKAISKKKIINTVETTNKYLKIFFGKKYPKIAIASLNPHGGENGIFGNEEKKIIIPAIKKIKQKKIDVYGPFPADTIFSKKHLLNFDVIICMYHDQATIPIKTLDFENGVNVTLGLPIIRTSPDHGTALDIAGCGKASEKSLYASIRMSQSIARKRKFWIQ